MKEKSDTRRIGMVLFIITCIIALSFLFFGVGVKFLSLGPYKMDTAYLCGLAIITACGLGYGLVVLIRKLCSLSLCRRFGRRQSAKSFRAMVEYIQPSFAELKSAFDCVHNDFKRAKLRTINRCKAISRETREVVFEYVHMNQSAVIDKVFAEMDKRGLRPALYEELLAFAKQYPDEQRQFLIIALGSVWVGPDGYPYATYLREGDGERDLGLSWCVGSYRDHCYFLAVSK